MAGVPWFFDNECQAYKVRAGFKFAAIKGTAGIDAAHPDPIVLLANAKKLLAEGERFLAAIRQLVSLLEDSTETSSK